LKMIPKFRLTHHQLGNKIQGFNQITSSSNFKIGKLPNHQIITLPNCIPVYFLCKTASQNE